MFYGNKTRWRFSLCLSSHNQGFRYTSLNHCVPLATVPSEIPSALLDSEKEAVFPPRIELGVNFSRLFVGEEKRGWHEMLLHVWPLSFGLQYANRGSSKGVALYRE
jgi:hypothetical protein